MTTRTIHIDRSGTMRFVYDDRLRGLLRHGEASVARASHVEPGDPDKGQDPTRWYVDLAPTSGPVLGPFLERRTALDKEVEWIEAHLGKES